MTRLLNESLTDDVRASLFVGEVDEDPLLQPAQHGEVLDHRVGHVSLAHSLALKKNAPLITEVGVVQVELA